MGAIIWKGNVLVILLLSLWLGGFCDEDAAVYIVTLKQAPVAHYYSDLKRFGSSGINVEDSATLNILNKPRNTSTRYTNYKSYLIRLQNSVLRRALRGEHYRKLYGYHYLVNGFAVLITPQQAEKLSRRKEVANIVLDFAVRTSTTYTPNSSAYRKELGLKKLVGARHFAASAITRGILNASMDHASPFDSDGHGTHTASIAAGNHGIPVIVAGHHFGTASGMAPHAHIAVYKALYRSFGGFAADVVAAIDQAAEDGVDIISFSITPNRRPPGIATFFNPIDMALLSAVKAGIFVVQAAGNTGPSPKSMSSFSPWIFTVGASSHDRIYNNYLVLGNNLTISGVGLAPGTVGDSMYTLIAPNHALKNDTTNANDMYLGECQDSTPLDQKLIKGKLLICSYSVRYVLGLSSVKQALHTAKNVSATGVIFYLDPFVIGFQLNPTPMHIPGLIIPSSDDSKVFLKYYNSSLVRNEGSKRIITFGAVAKILGGLKPNYSNSGPQVMYYSARGPDPEDSSLSDADILKPNLIAPGNFIWGAWSSRGTDSSEFQGEKFAMISGTSMAAPHVAGIAALIKQKFPEFSPAAIGSALCTTATQYDRQGGPIIAQRTYNSPDSTQSPATPFDMGCGLVNATAALDPGLIFDSGYDDFFSFLCGINGSGPAVLNYTGNSCGTPTINSADLNLPSITIAVLNQSRTVVRTVTNIANDETYNLYWSAPYGVSVAITPTRFFIQKGQKQKMTFIINAIMNSSSASFGKVGFYGSQGRRFYFPLSVISKIIYNTTIT
uniref:Subtilisin-like protease SBT2.2 n=1 Tax=Ananas comosus var. bracteatus TaxID=296719 RepID=A0A6V7PB88_ANACO|nr:unnamed protein product [Ananas comosus var. bracteatus]